MLDHSAHVLLCCLRAWRHSLIRPCCCWPAPFRQWSVHIIVRAIDTAPNDDVNRPTAQLQRWRPVDPSRRRFVVTTSSASEWLEAAFSCMFSTWNWQYRAAPTTNCDLSLFISHVIITKCNRLMKVSVRVSDYGWMYVAVYYCTVCLSMKSVCSNFLYSYTRTCVTIYQVRCTSMMQ